MKNILFLTGLMLCFNQASAQIGINTNSPDSMLHVNGTAIVEGSVYLEDPGAVTEIRHSKLLIKSPVDDIVQYDIDVSKYGPLNYAEFVFRGLSTNGLQDYDTKISTDKYIVAVQGFYYLEPGSDDTDVMAHSNISNDNIEGYQVYAYKNTTTQTWFLRAFLNNSEFHTRFGSVFAATPIDLYMNLIIYRRGFISKSLNTVSIDMGNSETGTAPLPAGF